MLTACGLLWILVSCRSISVAAQGSSYDAILNSLFTLIPNNYCRNTSQCSSPSNAFDGNNNTRWDLGGDSSRIQLTIDFNAFVIVDRFELQFSDSSSVLPDKVEVLIYGEKWKWNTTITPSCPDSYLRVKNSVYSKCIQLNNNQSFNVTVPSGTFDVRDQVGSLLWWKTFNKVQLSFVLPSNTSSVVSVQQFSVFGWNPPNQCNCHPAGVDTSFNSSCDENKKCHCNQLTESTDDCVPFDNAVVFPAYGPMSSGLTTIFSSISIFGNWSNMYLGNYLCYIHPGLTDDANSKYPVFGGSLSVFVCGYGSFNNADLNIPLPYKVCWQLSCRILENTYTAKPDPVITSITPSRSFIKGGIAQTITGKNLKASPEIIFDIVAVNKINIQNGQNQIRTTFYGANQQSIPEQNKYCHVNESETNDIMICYSPPLYYPDFEWDQYTLGSRYIQLIFGIYGTALIYSNSSLFNDTLKELMSFTVAGLSDPGMKVWSNEVDDFRTGTYNIEAVNFLSGCKDKTDYSVTVGGQPAKIENTIINALSFQPPSVAPPSSTSDLGMASAVKVTVGYISFHVGYIQYHPQANWQLIVGLVVGIGGGLLLILAIILIIVCCCRQRPCCEKPDIEREPFDPDNPNPYSIDPTTGRRVMSGRPRLMECLEGDLKDKVKRCLVKKERITLGAEIGKGNFGKVYQGKFEDSNKMKQDVAIKTLHNSAQVDYKEKVGFLEEAIMMIDFSHKNVLTLLAIAIDERDIAYVILPFMENGDLRKFVSDESNRFVLGDLLMFGLQVAEGMEYLASLKFVHRDLAARNCMVNNELLVKVADFGLARDIYDNDYYRPQDATRPLPFKWMAVECLSGQTKFSEKTDVWSYGVLLWELMTRGKKPYYEIPNGDLKRYLQSGRRLERPAIVPDFVYGLMTECWHPDPEQRPKFRQIKETLKEILTAADENPPTNVPQQASKSERESNDYTGRRNALKSNYRDTQTPQIEGHGYLPMIADDPPQPDYRE